MCKSAVCPGADPNLPDHQRGASARGIKGRPGDRHALPGTAGGSEIQDSGECLQHPGYPDFRRRTAPYAGGGTSKFEGESGGSGADSAPPDHSILPELFRVPGKNPDSGVRRRAGIPRYQSSGGNHCPVLCGNGFSVLHLQPDLCGDEPAGELCGGRTYL